MTSKAQKTRDDGVNATYAYCLRFFSELKALGVTNAIVSPGSRSTPLVLSAKQVGLEVVIHLDERVAAFHALGAAKATGVPSVLICSSGTAAANYLPAVVEANHAATPMIICTADRPPELRQWGEGQTINQVGLYGNNVRWHYDLPVASEINESHARSTALRAWSMSASRLQGPVHLNWPFRKPLEPTQNLETPEATLSTESLSQEEAHRSSPLASLAKEYERGLITVGPNSLQSQELEALVAFSSDSGWPILADPCSQLRARESLNSAPIITSGELLFAEEKFTSLLAPVDVIVHVGLPATSKAYRLWKQRTPPARYVIVSPGTDWPDPSHEVTDIIQGPITAAFSEASSGRGVNSSWCELWTKHNSTALEAVSRHVSENRCELSLTSQILSSIPSGTSLMLSNSMIVRDAELVLQNMDSDVKVISNRGANGIDGVISTGIGVSSSSEGPCLVLIGDVAAVHDIAGLVAAGRLQSDVVIVVLDNGGGAIFSFLPVAKEIDNDRFDALFTTPHHTNLIGIASSAGIRSEVIESPSDIQELLGRAFDSEGPSLFLCNTSIEETIKAYEDIRAGFQASFREE
tara:strand:+ start:3526 stop:5265 length:1740 start_codon:yes stop_codon:yes gene_type:complete